MDPYWWFLLLIFPVWGGIDLLFEHRIAVRRLRGWCRRQGFTLLHVEALWKRRIRHEAGHRMLVVIEVLDTDGHRRRGEARIGNYMLGSIWGKIDVTWDFIVNDGNLL